ncbi:MAG: endonuclease [Pedobacter sp.]
MKHLQKLIEQVEKTKQRYPASISSQPDANSPFKSKSIVDPKQVVLYLQENDLNLSRLINDPLLRERVIAGDDTLDVNYLQNGMIASKPVCRITICSSEGEEGYGTGFLIAPQILLTNNHVLSDADYGRFSYAEFNYEKGPDGIPLPERVFRFDPSQLFYTNEDLDYTIIWVEEQSADGLAVIHQFGFLKLNPSLGKTKEGNFVSVIQHPDGKMKKVALRQNEITNLSLPKFVRYVTDTKSGSSGAPVFNDKWEVVAVHHAGIPRYNAEGQIMNLSGGIWDKSQGEVQVDWIENEGVRVSSIIYDITTAASIQFPRLCEFFKPLTDLEAISKSMGVQLADLENDIYYPEEKDAPVKIQYYSRITDPLKATNEELHLLLEETHTSHHNYSPSKFVYPKVDLHPDGLLRSVYSNKAFSVQELTLADQKVDIERQLRFIELTKGNKPLGQEELNQRIGALEEALPYNCEHVVCQSWFNKQEPMRGDLHHLFACESGCNSYRSNYPYHDFPGYDPQPASTEKERSACGNMEKGLFEPENNRGVVARAVLYFMVRYPNAIRVYDSKDIDMLKGWAADQPVTLYEKHRNREIYLLQGNRNPFIDYPELAETITFNQAPSKENRDIAVGPPTVLNISKETKDLSLADLVKLSVLKSGGKTSSPDELDEGTALRTLVSRPEQFVMLRAYLFNVVTHFKPGANISVTEIEGVSSVGALINLVKGKVI